MALYPLTPVFEILFFFLFVILYREDTTIERLIAVGLLFFEIPLLTANQQFFSDASGTLSLVSIAAPQPLLSYVIFANFLLIFLALYKWWDLHDAKKKVAEANASR